MTKKDYKAIASALKEWFDDYDNMNNQALKILTDPRHGVAGTLANVMKSDDPKFNHITFYKAMGVTDK